MNEGSNRLELIVKNAPQLADHVPSDWARQVLLWLEEQHPSCVTNGGEVRHTHVVEAMTAINPHWVRNLPECMKPGDKRSEVEELQAHLRKLRHDTDEYIKLVPHAADSARKEAESVERKLERKLHKVLGLYFASDEAVDKT